MQQLFKPGDVKTFFRVVRKEDCAAFDSGLVHPVYATFALARDAEWCCRLFVLDMKDPDEEGIGTMISLHHVSPALEGASVVFIATVKAINGHEIICSIEVKSGERLIAKGEQGQKILKRDKLDALFYRLNK